jgi:hypothetical protein
MPFPAELFSNVAKDAGRIFSGHGFHATKEELNGAFGSHYVQFEKNNEVYLLLWDGKEEWLTIRTPHIHGNAAQEIFFRNLRDGTNDERSAAVQAALQTLQDYFSASHDHDEDGNCCGHHHP